MSKISSPLAIAIAIALLAGSAVGVAAQEAPVEFTAEWGTGRVAIVSGEPVVSGDYARQYRGEVWEPWTVTESTDPRFAGDLSVSFNHDEYEDGSTIWAVAFTVHGDEGAWLMEPTVGLRFPGITIPEVLGLRFGETRMNDVVFVGEGAYDGLLALVKIERGGSGWDLHGYIVDEASLPTVEPYRP